MRDAKAHTRSPPDETVLERDDRLLTLWRQGDASKGLELLQHYLPLFYQLCARRGLTRQDDLLDVQGELVVELLQNLDRYWVGSSFASCLHVAFRTAHKRFVRSRSREVTVERLDEEHGAASPELERIDEAEETESLLADVLDCTRSLTRSEYDVFSARALEKRSYEEIARLTTSTAGALRVRYHRAIAKLRECLRAKGGSWAHVDP